MRAIQSYTLSSSGKYLKSLLYWSLFIAHLSVYFWMVIGAQKLHDNTNKLILTNSVRVACSKITRSLTKATLWMHRVSSVPLGITPVSSDLSGSLQPLSKRLILTKKVYSEFFPEYLSLNNAVKHSLHPAECPDFIIPTDHKPIVYSLHTKPKPFYLRR